MKYLTDMQAAWILNQVQDDKVVAGIAVGLAERDV